MLNYKQKLIRDSLTDLPKVLCVSGSRWMSNVTLDFFLFWMGTEPTKIVFFF